MVRLSGTYNIKLYLWYVKHCPSCRCQILRLNRDSNVNILPRYKLNLASGQGIEFDLKYHILHDFRTSTSFRENPFVSSQDFHKLKLLINFDVNLTSLPGEL